VVARERGKTGALASTTVITAHGLDFEFSPPWKLADTGSSMRSATLTMRDIVTDQKFEIVVYAFGPEREPGDTARITLTAFPDDKNPIIESVALSSSTVTLVRASGDYAPSPFKPERIANFGMAAAAIPTKDGVVVLKLIGPLSLVNEHYDAFRKAIFSPFKRSED